MPIRPASLAGLRCLVVALLGFALLLPTVAHAQVRYFDVPRGSHPHDVAAAPAPDGPVYYTAQRTGKLGVLDPATGKVQEIALGAGSSPHGR